MVTMSMKVSRYDALHLSREQLMQTVHASLEDFFIGKIGKAFPQDRLQNLASPPRQAEELEEQRGGEWKIESQDFWFMFIDQAELACLNLSYYEKGSLLFGVSCFPQQKSFLEFVKGGQLRIDQRNIRIHSKESACPIIRVNSLNLPQAIHQIPALFQVSGSLSKDFYDFFMLRVGALILEIERLPDYWAEAVKSSGAIFSKSIIDNRTFFFVSSVSQATGFQKFIEGSLLR